MKLQKLTALSVLTAALFSLSNARAEIGSSAVSPDMAVTPAFKEQVATKVDELVRKHFYDAKKDAEWNATFTKLRPKILASKDLIQLDENVNEALHALKTSHTQFVTTNDEIYYFLHTLLGQRRNSTLGPPPSIDFVGAITGGVSAKRDEVRYVLDGSPAAAAGIRPGDIIQTVNGERYIGQLSFKGTAGTTVDLQIDRPGEGVKKLQVKPLKKNDADMYAQAIGKSAKVTEHPEGKIGYVHLWSGGERSHDAFEYALSDDVQKSDALIVDMRDGYGGNFFDDLDFFYRPAAAYPSFKTYDRKGKVQSDLAMYYDKPLVALINGGSRSGKELIAYSLKKTGRAVLVGERTAGAVVAGRLFRINDRSSLYLAVSGGDVEGLILEGVGVTPNVEVKQTYQQMGKQDLQLAEAVRILREKLKSSRDK